VGLCYGRRQGTHARTPQSSIKEFGFVNPILIDGSNGIIAGHGRVEAAKLLGMGDIPTVRADHLTPAQVRAYVIADNRLAELAGWDRKLLALELQELSIQPNFDVSITGFDTAEVDILIGELNGEARSWPMCGARTTRPGSVRWSSSATPWRKRSTTYAPTRASSACGMFRPLCSRRVTIRSASRPFARLPASRAEPLPLRARHRA
jgi:ParB-like nuclease domain